MAFIPTKRERWERDPGIAEFIDHLDAARDAVARKHPKWDSIQISRETLSGLKRDAALVILKEADLCRKDFAYAARNYFWIEDKRSREDKLFSLWESQELILEKMRWLASLGTAQRIMIIKARQLGISTLTCGLISWRTMFFPNANSLIVSYDPEHAADIFRKFQKIYDRLPWWLKPMCRSREFKTGMLFDNESDEDRQRNPGLDSKILVAGANAKTGFGQGRKLAAVHLSEWADYGDAEARDIIEEDIENAIPDDDTSAFALLESTAKGAGTYAHELWLRMEKLAGSARWYPLFLPWFFESTHRTIVDLGWKPQQEELDIYDRAKKDWVRCDSHLCRQYHQRRFGGADLSGGKCPTCNYGELKPVLLTNAQLAWMEARRKNAGDDIESQNKLAQEQASTAEDAFVVTGVQLFNKKCRDFANATIEDPIAEGFVDRAVHFHGRNPKTGRCYVEQCNIDHSREVHPLSIFEMPEHDAEYVIGADVAYGLGGKADYSVACVLKVNRHGGPDEQVAVWASNEVNPIAYADELVRLGKFYNEAMLAIEANKPDTTASWVYMHLQYPNLYRSKNRLNINTLGSRYGWITDERTKPNLYTAMRQSLESRKILLRDKFTVEELKFFRKEHDSAKTGAAAGHHDDRVMASCIALFTAHENDWDETMGLSMIHAPLTMETAKYHFLCFGCQRAWPSNSPTSYKKCPKCGTMQIGSQPNTDASRPSELDPDADLLKTWNDEAMEFHGADLSQYAAFGERAQRFNENLDEALNDRMGTGDKEWDEFFAAV